MCVLCDACQESSHLLFEFGESAVGAQGPVGGRLLCAQRELSGLAPGNFARVPAAVVLGTPFSLLIRDLNENQVIAGLHQVMLMVVLKEKRNIEYDGGDAAGPGPLKVG